MWGGTSVESHDTLYCPLFFTVFHVPAYFPRQYLRDVSNVSLRSPSRAINHLFFFCCHAIVAKYRLQSKPQHANQRQNDLLDFRFTCYTCHTSAIFKLDSQSKLAGQATSTHSRQQRSLGLPLLHNISKRVKWDVLWKNHKLFIRFLLN